MLTGQAIGACEAYRLSHEYNQHHQDNRNHEHVVRLRETSSCYRFLFKLVL
jgi:hypothetical protein